MYKNLVLILLFLSSFALKQDNERIIQFNSRKIEHNAFKVGERLVYDVKYQFVKVGEAEISIPEIIDYNGRKCYRAVFRVWSLPFFSVFYKVEDRYESYIDVEGIYPWRFEQHIREGGYKFDFYAEFDHVNLIAKTSEGVFPIPQYAQDVFSAFYYARTQDYSNKKVGERVRLENFYKNRTYPLEIKYLGEQMVKVKAGKFKCVVVEPLIVEGGLFKAKGRFLLWITNDDKKIPVKMTAEIPIGNIVGELREFEGIENIKSKVD
ncbi:DUF3108 domain-containing protein [Candidatus Chrysopegis kryptomonas]|jgi:hypothetical protein|uniref:DUF3108 domain-containing protein n=1 Tax=Candidatus Chryseopegocella kryptomonas TaxID=1633643 RepID=A0A0N7MYR5_9BACT|nr:DUF3108 domain-containing protein [Candidatus Chrysopegis kryptomonas]CUT04979.1 Protein of unknown function (DUF3108) [Candidatus Chrysopegis kryptomonas]